jgi:hypothetical protein
MYYLSIFDGLEKEFEGVEHIFEALYRDDCKIYMNEVEMSREQIKAHHAKKMTLGSKATLLHFQVKSLNTIQVKYRLVNEEEDLIVSQLIHTDGADLIVEAKVTKQDYRSEKKNRKSLYSDMLNEKPYQRERMV